MLTCKLRVVYNSSLMIFIFLLVSIQCQEINGSVIYRLDNTVRPDVYDIAIKPYFLPEDGNKQFTFDGQVNITLHATEPSVNNITLHADLNYISIENSELYDATGKAISDAIRQLHHEPLSNLLTVMLQGTLQVNTNYTLHFRYAGQIRDGLAGFYKTSYIDSNGKQKWIAITQAQSIEARTFFPCFDEPALKAVFKMHICRPRTYNAVFNTRLLNSNADGTDRFIDHFDATPRMSTYLVAFVISDFVPRGNAALSFITRPDYLDKTEYSFNMAQRALATYDNYTQLPYRELGNAFQQNVGVPAFPHNGMENWGLIIYKDTVLVQEPEYTDGWANKQYTARIIVHETAHMWFGNSVTFAWWSCFWLNEAFARYYEYFLTHQISPEFEMEQQFLVNQMHTIFVTDALNTTQPLTSSESSVQSPAEIAHKFSGITYAKGACIIRMFRNAMGHENFDIAIRSYLKQNHLQNTVPAELFRHLKQNWPKEQEVDLDQLFFDWSEQVGYPVLYVNFSSDRKSVGISQKRYLLAPKDGSDAFIKYTIPITYSDNNEKDFVSLTPRFYLNRTQSVLNLYFKKSLDWIIFNVQQTGYYRVLYDMSTLKNIKTALLKPNHSGIPPQNRAQLINDLFCFAQIGEIKYDAVFEFLEYLEQETDYLPWYAYFAGLTRVAQRTPMERQQSLGIFLLDVSTKVYKKLRFEADNDTVLDVYNRNHVVNWVCKFGGELCKNDALAVFDNMTQTGIKPVPDFRETVYCTINRVGYDKHFFYLYEQYVMANMMNEKQLILRAMGCTRLYRVVSQYYALILSTEVPVELKQCALTALYSQNPENVSPVFNMMSETIERLAEALGSWSNAANVISDIADYFTTSKQKEALDELIEAQKDNWGTSITKLRKAIKTVEDNLQWSETHLGQLYKYLDSRNGASSYMFPPVLLFFTVYVIWYW